MSLDVAIVRGHARDSQGAVAVDGLTEWEWADILGRTLWTRLIELGLDADVFERDDSGRYDMRMRRLCDRINHAEPRLVVSLHFNAAPPSKAGQWSGVGAVAWPGSGQGLGLAQRVAYASAAALGSKVHLVEQRARSWWKATMNPVTGEWEPAGQCLRILQWTNAPAAILETHFGDHQVDHARAVSGKDALAAGLARALVEHLQGLEAA